MPSEARLHFINSRLCCAAALPPLTSFLFQSETALADAHSQLEGAGAVGGGGSTSPLPPHTSQCRWPLPLQAGQAVVLLPLPLGPKPLSGIFCFLRYLLMKIWDGTQSLWTMMAQAIRAILLASATAATFVCRRSISRASHGRLSVPCFLA